MNNREKEVLKYTLEQEKAVIAQLKDIYSQALDDIGEKIKILMADELMQSKIYQIEYQKALKGQVSAILENLNSQQYDSISEYLRSCYEDGFIGALYDLQGYGIPLIIPIDQEQVARAIMLDSKISEGLYTKLGNNVSELKKAISQEISRGISTAMPYADIARNLRNRGNMTINQSMNIVQTEGHRIQSRSALDAGEKAKAKGADLVKVWDSTLDSKTRPHHRALDGQVRELEEDFEVDGLTADSPGHFGTPSEDCRCRCAVLVKPRWDADGAFTKFNNETGELMEFADIKSYEEFKNKYWETVDKSGGSGIIESGKNYGKYRGQIDVPYQGMISSKDLDEFNKNALKSVIEETGMSEKDARIAQSAIQEWCGDDYKSFTNGQQKNKEKIINDCLGRMGAYDGEIQRGMSFQNALDGAEFLNAKVGETVSMKSVSAWSNDSGVAARYAKKSGSDCDSVVLICDNNKSAVGVQHISKWGTMEAEVLAPSTSKWEVVEKTVITKYDYIKNELLPNAKIPPKKKRLETQLKNEESVLKAHTLVILRVKEV